MIIDNISEFEETVKKIDIKNDINQFIEKNKGILKPDEEILFNPYEPITKINDTKESEDFKYYVMREMKQNFTGIFPDFNLEFEDKKNELRKMTINFFKTNVKFNEQEKLLELLKEKKFRDFFLLNLSKQRTQGRYARKEEIIDNLKEVLKLILEIAEKEKDYEAGKNCIILSQTYYIEDKNDKNKKVYLVESIEDNKWLKSIDFWNGIIEFMTKKEIEKNIKISKKNKSNFDEKEKKKIISNAGFSQLLSYANNMVEFNIDKETIKRVIDKFAIKYEIEKNLVEAIYANSGITGEIDVNAYNPEEDKIEENKNDNEKIEPKEEEEKKEIKDEVKNDVGEEVKNNEENNN
jgi:hypothetical protein